MFSKSLIDSIESVEMAGDVLRNTAAMPDHTGQQVLHVTRLSDDGAKFSFVFSDMLYEYEVTEVRLHQLTLDDAIHATTEELWLQTSEGPKGTPGKTQLLALPLITLPADHKAAHPTPHPVNCA